MKLNLNLENQKPESSSFTDLLPAGTYNVAFSKAELVTTKSGHALKLYMTVVDGTEEGKLTTDFINFQNASEVAQKIALSRLRKIADLVLGKPVIVDSDELIGKRVQIKVTQKTSGEYLNNEIQSYSAYTPTTTHDIYAGPESSPLMPPKKNPWE